jgi:hypothetical protein
MLGVLDNYFAGKGVCDQKSLETTYTWFALLSSLIISRAGALSSSSRGICVLTIKGIA